MAYLSITNVSKVFGRGPKAFPALEDVNLDIERGEFVCFIGHSGCGKSTLLNLIAGLDEPTDGSLVLDGKAIAGPGADRGMVFQSHSLLPWLTAHDNVYQAVGAVYPAASNFEKRKHTERFLGLVGLWEARDKKPGELSGGMKQRVAIARALAVQPKVLLLDEPFGALDALTKGGLHDELLDIWQNHRTSETVLMVTHDIEEAIYLADRIVVMTNGPRATIGTVLEVPLPRPRSKRGMLHMPEYAEVKDRLLNLLSTSHEPTVAA